MAELHPENLRPFGSLTPEEAYEIRRKGALAKAEKIRQRKTLQEALDYLLSKEYTNDKGNTATGIEIVAIGLFNKAKAGDTAAIRLLAELVGEAESQGVTVIPQILVNNPHAAEDVAALMTEE